MTHVRLKWPSRSTPAVLCHARVWMWPWILKMWKLQPVDWLSLVPWLQTPFLLETMTIGNKHHSLGRLRPVGCVEDQLCPVVVVVQSLSHTQVFATPWTAAHQVSLSFTVSCSLLKLMSIELVMPSNHLIFCHPLLLLPSIFPSINQLFASGGQSIGASASPSVLPVNIQVWFPLKSLLRRTHLYLSTCTWNVVTNVICYRFNDKACEIITQA